MDVKIRAAERLYDAQPTGENLLALLREFAYAGAVPAGDIKALTILNNPAHHTEHWYRSFDKNSVPTLVDLGYPMGVYFNLKITQEPSDPDLLPSLLDTIFIICKGLHSIIERQANELRGQQNPNGIIRIDSIDELDVSPGNERARAIAIDGRPRYHGNIDFVINKLRYVHPNLPRIIESFSSVIQEPKKTKSGRSVAYRIFIPAIELDRAYWPYFITTKGQSRSTLRERASSKVDWCVKNQVKVVKTQFYLAVREWIANYDRLHIHHNSRLNATPTNLGVNLALALPCYWHYHRHSWLY